MTSRKLGPWLVVANLVLATATALVVLAYDGPCERAVIDTVRILTRIGVCWFVLAFIARPLHDVVQTRLTTWLRANRRYLGLSFAAWHLLHFPLLTYLCVLMGTSAFWKMFLAFGPIAATTLALIVVLAATSFNGAQRALGKRAWTVLHTIGIYAIALWFVRVYYAVSTIPNPRNHGILTGTHAHETYAIVLLATLCSAIVFRLAVAVRRVLSGYRGVRTS